MRPSTLTYAVAWTLILCLPKGNVYAVICIALVVMAFVLDIVAIAKESIGNDHQPRGDRDEAST